MKKIDVTVTVGVNAENEEEAKKYVHDLLTSQKDQDDNGIQIGCYCGYSNMSADQRGDIEPAWNPIKNFNLPDRTVVDVWMHVWASPLSFGIADSFRVPKAWRVGKKWFHIYKGIETELNADYITHFQSVL